MAKRASKGKKVRARRVRKSAPKSGKKSLVLKRSRVVDPFPDDDPFRL
jgi:hypothetical protein